MTFFDEISKNLTGYGKEAARKAKDAAQVLYRPFSVTICLLMLH